MILFLLLVYEYKEERIVIDGNLITSRSPGTTFLFALTLVEKLVSQEVNKKKYVFCLYLYLHFEHQLLVFFRLLINLKRKC